MHEAGQSMKLLMKDARSFAIPWLYRISFCGLWLVTYGNRKCFALHEPQTPPPCCCPASYRPKNCLSPPPSGRYYAHLPNQISLKLTESARHETHITSNNQFITTARRPQVFASSFLSVSTTSHNVASPDLYRGFEYGLKPFDDACKLIKTQFGHIHLSHGDLKVLIEQSSEIVTEIGIEAIPKLLNHGLLQVIKELRSAVHLQLCIPAFEQKLLQIPFETDNRTQPVLIENVG